MSDRVLEFEQTPTDPEQFVVDGVMDVASAMVEWRSVGPATDINRRDLVEDPAKALSQVLVEDPKLRLAPEHFKNPTDETLSLAIPLFLAKGEQVRREKALGLKEKRELGKARRLVSSLLGPKGRNTAVALSILATGCSSVLTPPLIEPTPTLAPITQETEVAPDLQEIVRPIESALVLDQQALFENRPIEAEFEKFRSVFLGLYGGTMPENVNLVAEGIYTTYLDGGDPTLHPLFSIKSTNPDIPSLVNVLISIPNGDGTFTFKLIPLERGEWTNDQGVTWVTLSATNHTRTDMPLADPLEVFAIRKEEIDNPGALANWSPSGNALDSTKSSAVKVLAVLVAATPESFPTPTPVAPESFTNNRSLLEREGFRIEREDGPWRLVTGDEENPTEVATAPDSQTISIRTVDGQELSFPQEVFSPKSVDGIDTKLILTVENKQNEVEYFYLEGQGWVTPIEIQTNPENREEYTPITPEDVWSGRLLYSELLVAEPFSDGTIVPDRFVYEGRWLHVGYEVVLYDYVDTEGQYYDDVVKYNNDFRRWIGFYKTRNSEGEEIIVAAEQVLNSDGRTYSIFHYAFSDVWDDRWEGGSYPAGSNLVNSVFLAQEGGYRLGKFRVRPHAFYIDDAGRQECVDTATCEFYEDAQNRPMELMPNEVLENIENRMEGTLGTAGNELGELQRMLLTARQVGVYSKSYFENK